MNCDECDSSGCASGGLVFPPPPPRTAVRKIVACELVHGLFYFVSVGEAAQYRIVGSAILGDDGRVSVSGIGLDVLISQHLTLDAGRTVLAGVMNIEDTQGEEGATYPGLLFGVQSRAGSPKLLLPAAGKKLTPGVARFHWSDEGTPVEAYALWLGSAPGQSDLYPAGAAADKNDSGLAAWRHERVFHVAA